MRASDDEDSSDDEDDESELEDEAAPAAKSTAPTTAPPSKPANADNTAPGSIIPQSDLTEGNGTAQVANERGGVATIRDNATEQHHSDTSRSADILPTSDSFSAHPGSGFGGHDVTFAEPQMELVWRANTRQN